MSRLVALLVSLTATVAAADELWRTPLPQEAEWSRVTWTGSLLVGGKDTLTHINGDGAVLWSRDDLGRLAPFNVQTVPGSDALLVNRLVSKIPPKSQLTVVAQSTGETIWATDEVIGNNLGAYPVLERQMVIFARDAAQAGQKAGSYLSALDLTSGEVKWETRVGRVGSLPVHVSDAGGFIPATDLSGHPQPVVVGDTFLLQAGNLFAVDLESGELKWEYKLKAHNAALKNAYAQPIVHDGTIYAAGARQVVALDLATGAPQWTAKVSNAPMPELRRMGDSIVVRYGGVFSNGKTMVAQKPFGLAVVDASSGAVRWEWKKAKDSVTNLGLVADSGMAVIADKSKLYAFDINGRKGNPAITEKLEFKRKMGNAELAAKGLGAVGGLMSGGLAGGLRGAMAGGDRSDPPVDVTVDGSDVIVRGQYHVMAFNVDSKSSPWSIQFAPPGVNSLALLAAGAVTTAASVGGAQGAWASPSQQRRWSQSVTDLSGSLQDMAARRFSTSERARNVAFFLTKDKKEMRLVGIDLTTGEEVGTVAMTEKSPLFTVDPVTNTVFHLEDATAVVAHTY